MTKHITTGDLEIAYEQWGDGERVILLLHGFPDDATAWEATARLLPSQFRAIAPYVRGYGPTRFVSPSAIRTGQKAAQLADLVALLDALDLENVFVAGHDWGQGTGQALAALYPDRVRHLVTLGDYALTFERPKHFSLKQLWAFRFHLMMNTPLAEGMLRNPKRLARRLWRRWAPEAPWNEAAFQAMLPSLSNPDFAAVVLSAYRSASGKGAQDPRFEEVEKALSAGPPINVPTTIVRATADPLTASMVATAPSSKFTEVHKLVELHTGHWPQREQPEAIASLISVACSQDC